MNPAETTPVPPPAARRRPRSGRRARAVLAALAALAAVTVSGCAAGAAQAPVPAPRAQAPAAAELTEPDVTAWLDGFFPAALEATAIPGATVSVVHDGELLTARGYGWADTGVDGDRAAVDPEETLFRVGSVSKLFTATAVMQLVEAGEVELDTPVAEYVDFPVPHAFDTEVTLRHLLTHTPGFEERVAGLIEMDGDAPDLRAQLAADPPEQVYEPGTTPAYSNYGSALAGHVVEQVSGVPFDAYVDEHILAPLGMDSSTFTQPLPEELRDRLAAGYTSIDAEESGPFEVVTAPAGALTASATDMARFMLAHLGELDGDAALLADGTREEMHSPGLDHDALGTLADGPRMTLGFFEEDRNGHRALGHGGDTNFFHSHLQLYPDHGTGVFVSVNGGGADDLASVLLRESLLAGFADRYYPADDSGDAGEPAGTATAAEHAAIAEGTYGSSRSMHSTFLAVLGPLGGQTRIEAREDGTILVTPGPETMVPTAYEEIEPWVWREVGGQRTLTMRVEDDRVTAIGYASAFALLPVDGVRDAGFALPLVIGSVVLLLGAALSWPAAPLVRRRLGLGARDRSGVVARVLTRVGAGLALAALAGWLLALSAVLQFAAVPAALLAVPLAAQWAGVLALVPAGIVLVDDIRRRSGWRRVLASALVLLGLLGVAVFAGLFGLLSFDLTY
ncbi:serine hydrolase domain-containing protein [Streptomyces bohaiensis]|uniref:Beta-lactamase family protein n=2 Tax=Streptomyces bohaiensis TaxID=1431344 RepID=A0ABX1CDL2_9ACTN|nr:serine hydrolase domain-containing protein [Streptomyces bohaiensis]NJQ17191.1 beta-lactamase family protein [Streptomyces bohaiensis]